MNEPSVTQTKFTPKERLTAGLLIALLAAIVNIPIVILLSSSSYLLYVFVCGFLCGLLILPFCLIPDRYLAFRALGTGCLATLATASLSGIYIAALVNSINQETDENLWAIGSFAADFLPILMSALITGMIASIISAPATMLFSYILAKKRKRVTPEINLEAFE